MKKLLLALFLSLFLPSIVNATTYWVATTGSDANTCASVDGDVDPGTYKATITSAIGCLSASDTIIVKTGTYNQHICNSGIASCPTPATIPSGTSWSNPTTIKAETGATVTLNGNGGGIIIGLWGTFSYIVIDGFIVDAVNMTENNTPAIVFGNGISSVKLSNIEVKNNPRGGGVLINSDVSGISANDIQIINVWVHDLDQLGTEPHNNGIYCECKNSLVERSRASEAGTGIWIHNGFAGDEADDNIVRYSIAHDNVITGISTSGSRNLIHNNLSYGNPVGFSTGYFSGGPGAGDDANRFYNNVSYNNGDGFNIGHFSDAANTIVKNNISHSNSTNQIVNNGTDTTFGGNLCSAAGTGCEDVEATATNVFIAPASNDFNLKEGSPAVDSAGVITGFSEGRYVGSAPDAGAYEAPIFADGNVGNAARNDAILNFSFPSQGVTLQSCTATNFVINVAGSDRTSTACVIQSPTQLKVTFNGAEVAEGQALTARYARGTLTDKLLIGNLNNAKVRSFSAQPLSNNVIGGEPPSDVGWWRFDEGTGSTANDSEGTNHGTLQNTPTWVTGKIGNALDFDAPSLEYVSISTTHLTASDDWSLAAWVMAEAGAAERYIFVSGDGNGASSSGFFMLLNPSDKLACLAVVGTNSEEQTASNAAIDESGTVWTHVTCVKSGTSLKGYINGVEDGSITLSTATMDYTGDAGDIQTNIGRISSGSYFNGKIDEVRYYDFALSQSEINALVAGAPVPSRPGRRSAISSSSSLS